MKKYKSNITFKYAISILFGVALFLASCSNDLKEIEELTFKRNYPVITAENKKIVKTDSSKIKLIAFAPLLESYNGEKGTYTIFSEGISVIGFTNYPDTTYSITAKYAINWENKKLWEARIDVVVISEDGDTITTEQLFRDEIKGIIYSEQFTRISNKEGVFYGKNGFEALENGTKWKLKNIKNSTVHVKYD